MFGTQSGTQRSRRLKLRIWFAFLLAALFAINASAQQKITINYPNRSGANWPLFLAKEGGYYQKYGLDVTLTFGVMPAGIAMLVSGEAQEVNSSLEQLMQAASKDGSLVLIGSSLNRAAFALMAAKNIDGHQGPEGKTHRRLASGRRSLRIPDRPAAKSGLSARDVQWIPVGTDVNGRAAALASGRADATMLTAPAYFKLEEQGFKTLANFAEHPEIFASTGYLMKKSASRPIPSCPKS